VIFQYETNGDLLMAFENFGRTVNGVHLHLGARFRGHDPRSDRFRLRLFRDPSRADLTQERNLGHAWFGQTIGADYRSEQTDQGQLGSCTAFTVRELMKIAANLIGVSSQAVSAGFIYEEERRKEGGWPQDSGAYTSDGLDLVIAGGAPKESLAPYTGQASTEYDSQAVEADRPNQQFILSYHPINPRDPQVLQLMWAAIDSYMPLVVETQFPEGWFNPNSIGAVSTNYSQIAGGHSISGFAMIPDASAPGGGYLGLANHWTAQWNPQCASYGHAMRAGDWLIPWKVFTDANSPIMAIYAVNHIAVPNPPQPNPPNPPNPPQPNPTTEPHVQAANDAVAALQATLTTHPRSTDAKQQLKGGQAVQSAVQKVG
jgi:hypothetical protein